MILNQEMPPQGEVPMQPIAPQLTPEQKQDLTEKLNKVRAQIDSLKTTRFGVKNIVDDKRRQALKHVFDNFKRSGIDLSNREEVAGFIMDLQKNEPEMAQMFEKSMGTLLGEQPDGLER